jgi:hypothetical protein
MYPPIVARQRLGKNVNRGNECTCNNRRIVGRVVFSAVRVISGKWAISYSQNLLFTYGLFNDAVCISYRTKY